MPVIELDGGRGVIWEPTTDLICTACRQDVDIYTLHQNTLECVNFTYDLLASQKDGIAQGEYWYLHKRCMRIEDALFRAGAKIGWGCFDMKAVLGLDSTILRQMTGNVQKALKQQLPTGSYDRLYTQWLPAIRPVKKSTSQAKKTSLLVSTPRTPVQQKQIKPARPGYVYIIQAQGTSRVKIGRTTSTAYRFDSLRTASPFPLVLLRAISAEDAVDLERTLHRRYAAYRQHREWFDLPPQVLTQLLEEDL